MPNRMTEKEFKQKCSDLGVGLGEDRYILVRETVTCGECDRPYEKDIPHLTWPQLVGRCNVCGAPIIQRSTDSKMEDTCDCEKVALS